MKRGIGQRDIEAGLQVYADSLEALCGLRPSALVIS
jgi:hypothetical protein